MILAKYKETRCYNAITQWDRTSLSLCLQIPCRHHCHSFSSSFSMILFCIFFFKSLHNSVDIFILLYMTLPGLFCSTLGFCRALEKDYATFYITLLNLIYHPKWLFLTMSSVDGSHRLLCSNSEIIIIIFPVITHMMTVLFTCSSFRNLTASLMLKLLKPWFGRMDFFWLGESIFKWKRWSLPHHHQFSAADAISV